MPTSLEIRESLEAAVIARLLGPAGGPDEIVIGRNVSDHYLVGRLAPKGQHAVPEELDEDRIVESDGDEGIPEAPPPKAATLLPASIGMTFAVSGTTPELQITARWGRYERIALPQEETDKPLPKNGWQRIPLAAVSEPLPLKPGRLPDWIPDPNRPGVVVMGRVRRLGAQWIVTLFLVNGQQSPRTQKDTAWIFQPELSVAAPDGAPCFERPPQPFSAEEPDQQLLAMLYRRDIQFAVGHSVAVHTEIAPDCYDRAVRLTTTFMPTCDIPQVTAPTAAEIPALAGLILEMKTLAEIPDGNFTAALAPLAEAYQSWIADLQSRLDPPEADLLPYLETAEKAILNCRTALTRIRAGIALLDADPQAAAAFRFANRAMYQQRLHSEYAACTRRGDPIEITELEKPGRYTWRVFQLAFILINLPALTDPHHPDRTGEAAIADLLWFPTGGGKTEAYLGVTAYVLAMRRLQKDLGERSSQAGVAVLMRYTLRLLTLQQFQRAAALICACEIIRRENPERWGEEPFRLGLWVGRHSTPNWTQEADEAVKDLKKNAFTRDGTPHQITTCPWCGSPILPGRDIIVELPEQGRGRTFIYCGDELGHCPFSRKQSPDEGIPALVVDEEIYRRLPALLISTVDKFAQMPWNGRTAMLFGQVNGYCERHGYCSPEIPDSSHQAKGAHPKSRILPLSPLRPPDLIIQDELHLISGPLGTLVGLYETAVDRLASWDLDGITIHPKIIASTATIRRAERQVRNLFQRDLQVFPPQGLDVADNFFSRRRAPGKQYPGRRYLGLCAPGTRFKTALIQTYITFLAATQRLYNQYGSAVDPWMTLVGYFNSLRELGGMRRAVDDTVATRLHHEVQRSIDLGRVEELTSRKNAADIPKVLDRLEVEFQPQKGGAKSGNKTTPWPIDVLLATNMISVGVDVSRLGLMVVGSQPKNTAEYIQATSRVGRQQPGLICTVYNWTRPRDLSHYESFEHYHATFYQHVEPLSLTPFSPQALRRGLSAVLVSLVRLAGMEFNANQGAEKITEEAPLIQSALETIRKRANVIGGAGIETLVADELQKRLENWLHRAQTRGSHLGYQEKKEDGRTLINLLEKASRDWKTFTCLNSLRDVEPGIHLLLEDYGLDATDQPDWTFGKRDPNPVTEEDE